jgi:hypothetical protein
MSTTWERLMISSEKKPNSMLDRLHGGTLPKHLSQDYTNYHMLSGGTPHSHYNPNIRTDMRRPTLSGIPSEILDKTRKERNQELREDQKMLLKQFMTKGTIRENV